MASSRGSLADGQGLGRSVGLLARESGQARGSFGLGRKGQGLESVRGHMGRKQGHPGTCGLTTGDKWGGQNPKQEGSHLVLGVSVTALPLSGPQFPYLYL